MQPQLNLHMYATSKFEPQSKNDLDLHLEAANDCITVAHQRYVTPDRRRQLLQEYEFHREAAAKLLTEQL